jgi:hypothetical protein
MPRSAASKPELTDHVRNRMARRGITEEQIYTALAREQRRTPGEPGTIWIHGLVPGDETHREPRTLKVCITADRKRVITAAWRDIEETTP